MNVKLDFLRKTMRAGSTYDSVLMPRISKLSISLTKKWMKFSQIFPKGELVCTLLSSCPLKKSHGFWQRCITLLTVLSYSFFRLQADDGGGWSLCQPRGLSTRIGLPILNWMHQKCRSFPFFLILPV